MAPLMDQRKVLALTRLDETTLIALGDEAHAVGCELENTPNASNALLSLNNHPPTAVLVDFDHEDARTLCQNVRSKRRSVDIAVFALSSQIDDTTFLRALVAGADDVFDPKQVGALGARLVALPMDPSIPPAHSGDALIAIREPAFAHLIGRVLTNAGYDVEYARDALALRQAVPRPKLRLVVISRDFGEIRESVERLGQNSSGPLGCVVLANPHEVYRVEGEMSGIHNLGVVSRTNPVDDILYVANELLGSQRTSEARLDPRVPHGTVVRFGSQGSLSWDQGFSWNIGLNGLYVRTLAPPLDLAIHLELRAPGSEQILRLAGELVWQRGFGRLGTSTAPPGFGVRLTEGSIEDRELWSNACTRLAQGRRDSGSFVLSPRQEARLHLDTLPLIEVPPASSGNRSVFDMEPRVDIQPIIELQPTVGVPPSLEAPPERDPHDESAWLEPLTTQIAEPVAEARESADTAGPPSRDALVPEDSRFALPRIGGGTVTSEQVPDPVRVTTAVGIGQPAQPFQHSDLPSVVLNSAIWRANGPETVRRFRPSTPQSVVVHSAAEPGRRARRGVNPWVLVSIFGLAAFFLVFAGFMLLAPNPAGTRRTATPQIRSLPSAPARVAGLPAHTASLTGPGATEPSLVKEAAPTVVPAAPEVLPVEAAPSGPGSAALPERRRVPGAIERFADEDSRHLLSFEGYLEVLSAADTLVFAHGIKVGRTNQRNKVSCGLRFVRLGTAPGYWQSAGHTVHIKCQEVTRLFVDAAP